MPTTPDEPVAPRRRLGPGPATHPAVHRADRPGAVGTAATAADVAPQPVEPAEPAEPAEPVLEPRAVPDDVPEPVRESAPESEPVPESVPEPVREGAPEPEPVPAHAPEPPAADGEAAAEGGETPGDGRFTVRLANFEGPFDLLLQLISKHKLDVTEVALSKVTNEFMAHIHAMGPDWDLDQTTEFLVVAATLLDLKAARLLPAAEVEDEADLALLEARDLLFARLLQYRAYKQIAAIFAERLEAEAHRRPRTVGLEPQHAELLPEVVLSIGPERFAQLAVKAMQPRPKPQVYVDHIHAPLVSVREQAEHVIALLRARGAASFGELTADAEDTLTVVARFLALLELYREKAVALEQPEALGALHIRWTGGDDAAERPLVTDEFDQEAAPKGKRDGDGTAAARGPQSVPAATGPGPEPGTVAPPAPTTTEPRPSGEGEPQ